MAKVPDFSKVLPDLPDPPDNGVSCLMVPEQLVHRVLTYMHAAAEDLEAELRARYPEEILEKYPSEQRRYDRDTEIVKHLLEAAADLHLIFKGVSKP